MAIGNVTYEQQYVLRDTGGNIVWQGGAIFGHVYSVTSGETATTIAAGQAAYIDTTDANTVFGRDQNPSGNDPDQVKVSVLQCVSGAVPLIGVAAQPILFGRRGNLLGPGSLCAVRATSAAIALGSQVVASATAGLIMAAATKVATVPAYGTVLGVCIKANAQIPTATGFYTAGVLIAPA